MKSKLAAQIFVLSLLGLLCLSQVTLAETVLKTAVELPSNINSYPLMRVAIAQNVDKARLEFSSPYKVTHPITGDLLAQGLPQKDVTLNASKEGIMLGNRLIRSSSLHVLTEDQTVRVEGKTYRASLRVVKNEKGKLVLINEIDIEDYLKGVLPWEVDHRWHMEALKAQAVAARTFALFQALKNPNAQFFLTNDVKSQVYGGKTSEHLRTTEAVDATRGQILTYRGMIFQAYFHSSCGGKTTRADAVWSVVPLAPLTGVQCGFCQGSKYDSWSAEFSLEQIRKKLVDRGLRIGPISKIEALDRDRSGRVKQIVIYHSGGVYKMKAGEFRVIIGAEKMRSTLVMLESTSDKLTMTGKGWGHGVGFCQWGSKSMAERGFTYENIVRFYYPGSQITQAYSVPAEKFSEGWFSRMMEKVKDVFGG